MAHYSSILSSFELKTKEVEASVYKVINVDKEVNIDKLQWELRECILITSLGKGTEKLDTGIHTTIANVYYIIVDYDKKGLAYKYDDIATKEFGKTLYKAYKCSPTNKQYIDTLYGKDEV